MKITILGSGTAYPDLKRNSAGILLEHQGSKSLIDFGYGNVHQLLRLGITYQHIDRIYFTHHHPDHLCDLIYFLFACNYEGDPRTRDLEIVAAPGFQDYFNTLSQAFNRWLTPKYFSLIIKEQDEETKEYDGLQVTTARVEHIEMSRAYRFTDASGKSITVSGDTDYSPGYVELARNVDLMILECSVPDSLKIDRHSTPTLCGKMAHEAQCKTLCLTHFYPPCDMDDVLENCRKEFEGNIVLAQDLMTLEV